MALVVTDELQTPREPQLTTLAIAGLKLTPMSQYDMFAILSNHIASRRQCIIAYQNLHGMYVSYTNTDMRALHERQNTFVYIDSTPIYLCCRLFGFPVNRTHRITGVDYIWDLLGLAERSGWRIYFLGGSEEVVAAASVVIRRRAPGLAFRARHGYFDPQTAGDDILAEILDFSPDLVLVGMGMPLQEQWILNNAGAIKSVSLCAVGAILEYVSGFTRVPPRWLGPIGFEGLFRVAENPGRFSYRYLIEPLLLLMEMLKFALRGR